MLPVWQENNKHIEPVGFEFVIETCDSIKHYNFEDV